MIYDCIVVGAGPAGATLARKLSMNGFNVVCLDKERFPRHKPCGGCISAKIDSLFDFDISPVIDSVIYGVRFAFKGLRSFDVTSDTPIGYNVRRRVFDSFLVDKARDAGAIVLEGRRVKSMTDNGAGVRVECDSGEGFTGRFAALAAGAGNSLSKAYFNLNPKKSAVSLSAEAPYHTEAFKGNLFIDFGTAPYGYGWIFPKKGFLSVGIGAEADKMKGNIRDCFDKFISKNSLLKTIEIKERFGWTIPTFYSADVSLANGRVIAIGDAGHLVDPLLGEGIYYAIKSALAAGDVIAGSLKTNGNSLTSYDRWLKEELYPSFLVSMKLSNIIYRHPRLWYRLLEKEPVIMMRYYEVIRGRVSAAGFYQWVEDMVKSMPWKVIRGWVGGMGAGDSSASGGRAGMG